jgi:alkylation response protein AidB-like acyl-CoA dehydrogenase
MSAIYSPEHLEFRDELRAFFSTAIPQRIRDKVSASEPLLKADFVESQRILNAHGMAVPQWPVQWGGRGWDPIRLHLFTEELQRAAVPLPLQFNCNMIGPVLAAFGSEAQKQRFLARAANLDDWWCQGFSEPEAGSDLASVQTAAVRTEHGYRVNGQKTWTTYAQHADWIFCLVRTDPSVRKQAGISFLLIDMKSPGITVRPIMTVDGYHEVNEVFFDDVDVPFENLVGEENRGWTYAKFLLANERSGIARIGLTKERVARVRRLAQVTACDDGSLWDYVPFRNRVIELELELKALEITLIRLLSRVAGESEHQSSDPTSSILKIKGSQLQQQASELLMEVAGPDGLREVVSEGDASTSARSDLAFASYMNFRKVSIYGGSNEIQRNIIAKTVLGL